MRIFVKQRLFGDICYRTETTIHLIIELLGKILKMMFLIFTMFVYNVYLLIFAKDGHKAVLENKNIRTKQCISNCNVRAATR